MIFPDLPKRINFEQANTYEAPAPYELASSVQTPLRSSTDMSAAAWLAHNEQAKDPAASPQGSVAEWLEITAIAVAFCLWITYWRGVHVGAW